MKTRLFTLVLVALAVAACGQAAAQIPVLDDLMIELAVEPHPPAVGEATLVITVTDADGAPVEGATVAVHGDMDHAGMEPVDGESDEGAQGVYRVPFTWTMGGGWILDVTVTLPDNRGRATERFEVFVEAVSSDSILNQSVGDGATQHDAGGGDSMEMEMGGGDASSHERDDGSE